MVELGLGREGTAAVWEVLVRNADGTTGVEFYLAVASGELIKKQDHRIPVLARGPGPATTAGAATEAATREVPGGTVTALDLGNERNQLVWEVEVRQSATRTVELYLSAADLSVVKRESG